MRSGSGMGLAGGYSDGRDIGVVFNYPNPGGAHALPMCGGVGAQYTPAAGWAQAIEYKRKVLGEGPTDAIAVVLGGDASCATGGFWSALTIATTQQLPMLFYIEDNGYGISVPSELPDAGQATSPPTSPASAASPSSTATAPTRTKRRG